MNLRDILNAVLGESGFIQKPAFTSSADQDDKQMVAIANRVAQEIMEWADWSVLKKSHTITMSYQEGLKLPPGGTEADLPVQLTYDLPDDFLSIVADSVWETDGSRRVELPTPPNRWYMYKFSTFSDGGTLRARIYGNKIELYDAQPGEEFAFEYLSNAPIQSAAGTPQRYFILDDDEFLLDAESMIKGIQAKWATAKMMPQADKWGQEALISLNKAKGRDTGARTIGGSGSGRGWLDSRQPYYPLYRR